MSECTCWDAGLMGNPCPSCREGAAVDDLAREGQAAAINSAPELVPCGRFASVTHCCEYHGIHSDDDLVAALELMPTAEQLRADKRISIEAKRRLADFVEHLELPARIEVKP